MRVDGLRSVEELFQMVKREASEQAYAGVEVVEHVSVQYTNRRTGAVEEAWCDPILGESSGFACGEASRAVARARARVGGGLRDRESERRRLDGGGGGGGARAALTSSDLGRWKEQRQWALDFSRAEPSRAPAARALTVTRGTLRERLPRAPCAAAPSYHCGKCTPDPPTTTGLLVERSANLRPPPAHRPGSPHCDHCTLRRAAPHHATAPQAR